MTAALEGGEWSAARPGRNLPSGKNRYPFYRRLGGLQGRSGRAENLVPTGIRSRTVQPVVSRYTGWATRPTKEVEDTLNWKGSSASHALENLALEETMYLSWDRLRDDDDGDYDDGGVDDDDDDMYRESEQNFLNTHFSFMWV